MMLYRAALPLFLLATSCNQAPAPSASESDAIERLSGRIDKLQSELFVKTYRANETAYLSPTDTTFSFLDTEMATLPISVKAIEAAGDGSKLTLSVGNPTSATILNLGVHAQYGPLDRDEALIEPESREADRELANLLPGSWTTVALLLPGVPPVKFGRLILSKPKLTNIALTPR